MRVFGRQISNLLLQFIPQRMFFYKRNLHITVVHSLKQVCQVHILRFYLMNMADHPFPTNNIDLWWLIETKYKDLDNSMVGWARQPHVQLSVGHTSILSSKVEKLLLFIISFTASSPETFIPSSPFILPPPTEYFSITFPFYSLSYCERAALSGCDCGENQ